MNNDIDEFLIDTDDHYKILGHDLIVKLSTEFYTRVYNDEEKWFVDIFPKGGKEVRILYSQRRCIAMQICVHISM
jgi:hypothetical protein